MNIVAEKLDLEFAEILSGRRAAHTVLADVAGQIRAQNRIIRVSGNLKLTKSGQHPTHAFLLRDFELERSVYQWIDERVSYRRIMDRYRTFDPELASQTPPQHYAVRMLAGIGAISSGSNIFMFFPEVIGLDAKSDEDCFGFEFIDIWANIFRESVFRCWHSVFDFQSRIRLLQTLSCNLDRTIFLAAIFHEIGHRTGYFKVSPTTNPGLHISRFQLDILGELATDSQLVLNLREFPEIADFVFSQRIFWFGRRGFGTNPVSAWINQDNDSWISAMLWNRALADGVIERTGTRYAYHGDRVHFLFESVLKSVEELGMRLDHLASAELQQAEVELDRAIDAMLATTFRCSSSWTPWKSAPPKPRLLPS
ncbi:MAG: hypothetical protein HC902_11565 [Calothrix sp. SM1_5_4]|nr:hypothetical protein [Calothrix sp. SM1_5_4]